MGSMMPRQWLCMWVSQTMYCVLSNINWLLSSCIHLRNINIYLPFISFHLQPSAVIKRSNIVRYCINGCRNSGRISLRCWIHKKHRIPRPNGRAMRFLLWFFLENWSRYNDTALYIPHKHVLSTLYPHFPKTRSIDVLVFQHWTGKSCGKSFL